jgi:hypothetical protein
MKLHNKKTPATPEAFGARGNVARLTSDGFYFTRKVNRRPTKKRPGPCANTGSGPESSEASNLNPDNSTVGIEVQP